MNAREKIEINSLSIRNIQLIWFQKINGFLCCSYRYLAFFIFSIALLSAVFNSLLSLQLFSDVKNLLGIQLVAYSYFYDYFFYLILFSFIIRLFILWWFHSLHFLRHRYGFIVLGMLLVGDFLLFPKIIYPFTSANDLRYSPSLEQNLFIKQTVKSTERVGANQYYWNILIKWKE